VTPTGRPTYIYTVFKLLAQKTLTFGGSLWCSMVACGCSKARTLTLCPVGLSTRMECGFVRKNNAWDECFITFLFFGNEIAKTGTRLAPVAFDTPPSNAKRRRRTRRTVKWRTPSSRPARRVDFCGLLRVKRCRTRSRWFRQRYEVDPGRFGAHEQPLSWNVWCQRRMLWAVGVSVPWSSSEITLNGYRPLALTKTEDAKRFPLRSCHSQTNWRQFTNHHRGKFISNITWNKLEYILSFHWYRGRRQLADRGR